MSKSLCIIPARGGSKRIPRKNVKDFHGKPIIAYSIETALDSGLFDEVMVSTDCAKIREISLRFGARVPFVRSESNSNDFATTIDVVNEVVDCYRKSGDYFDTICVFYPCAPFVSGEDLSKAHQMLKTHDCVVPVVRYDFPPLRSFRLSKSSLSYMWPEFEKARSQDLEDLYHDAGQWYFFNNSKHQHSTLIKKNTAPLILESNRVQDIDTISDWELASIKFGLLKRESL